MCRLRPRSVVYRRRWFWRRTVAGSRARPRRRSVILTTQRLRNRVMVGRAVRPRGLVHMGSRLTRRSVGPRNVFLRTRLLVGRRSRHVLGSVRLIVFLRTRCGSCVGVLRRTIDRRQRCPGCSSGGQLSRLWRSGHCRTSLISRHELRGIALRRLLMLYLRRGLRYVALMFSSQLFLSSPRLNSTRPAVIGDMAHADVPDRLVVNVAHIGDIDVVHRAVVVEVAAMPVSAVVSGAGIAKAVVNAAVESNGRAPVARMPVIESGVKAPVAGRPQETGLRSQHPRSRHPVVASQVRVPSPVTRRPDVARGRADWL